MEEFEWNPDVKRVFEDFEWDNIKPKNENNKYITENPGLLSQIGYDHISILMDLTSSGNSCSQRPAQGTSAVFSQMVSSLSLKNHHKYLAALIRFRDFAANIIVPAKTRNLWNQFQLLKMLVMEEQKKFLDCALQASLVRISDYDQITPHADIIVKDYIRRELERIHKYMRYYIHHEPIRISVFHHGKDQLPQYEKLAAILGFSPMIEYPKIPLKIPVIKSTDRTHKHKKIISEDAKAEKLAVKWKADVVLSLSALRTLANNHGKFANEWEIPLTVRELRDESGNTKSVVFIDKAFPAKSINGRDSCCKYFKKAVKHLLLSSPEQTQTKRINEKSNTSSTSSPKRSVSKTTPEDNDIPEKKARLSSASDSQDVLHSSHKDDTSSSEFSRSSSLSEGNHSHQLQKEEHSVSLSDNFSDGDLVLDESSDVSVSIPQLDGANDKTPDSSTEKRKNASVSSTANTPVRRSLRITSDPELHNKTCVVNPAVWQTSFLGKKSMVTDTEKNKVTSLPFEFAKASSTFPSWFQRSMPENTSTCSEKPQKNIVQKNVSEKHMEDSDDAEQSLMIDLDYDYKSNNSSQQLSADATSNSSKNLESESANGLSYEPSKIALELTKTLCDSDKVSLVPADNAHPNLRVTETTHKPPRRSTRRLNKSGSQSAEKSINVKETSSKKVTRTKKVKQVVVISSSSEDDVPLARITRQSDKMVKVENTSESESLTTARAVKATKRLPSKFIVGEATVPLLSRLAANVKLSSSKLPDTAMEMDTKPPLVKTKSKTLKNVKNAVANESRESANFQSQSEKSSLVENNSKVSDVLGQILDMQKERAERSTKESDNIFPDNSTPGAEDLCFDDLLEAHSLGDCTGESSVFYNLWSFGNVRVLVRGYMHGKIERKERNYKSLVNYVTVRTKLEYQADLGYEQLSFGEACSEWIDHYFRPKPNSILRCRVNPATEEIICVDNIVYGVHSFQHYGSVGFNELRMVKLLTTLFVKFTNQTIFPTGSYIVCHKSGASEVITRKATDTLSEKIVVYDLYQEYSCPGRFVPSTPNNIPWMSLDPLKQLPWQLKARRIPLTFDVVEKTGGSANSVDPQKHKKNKGKKKKKKARHMTSQPPVSTSS